MSGTVKSTAREFKNGARPLWASVLALHMSGFVVIGFSFGVFAKPLSEEFDWTRSELFTAYSIFFGVAALFQPLVGRLVDRVGLKRTVIPFALLYGLGLISLYWLTSSKLHFYAVYIVLGATCGATGPLPYFKLISYWFDKKRGFALGLLMAGTSSGAILVPALSGFLVVNLGWRLAYVVLGVASTAVIVSCVALIRERPARLGAVDVAARVPGDIDRVIHQGEGMRLKAVIRTKEFWLITIAMGAMYFVTLGVIGHISPLLIDHGATIEIASLAGSVFAVGAFSGRLIGGYLMDRVFAPKLAAVLFAAAGFGLFSLLWGGGGSAAFLGAFLVGLSFGAETDIMGFLTGRYFGTKSFGEIFSYLYSVCLLVGVLGPVTLGYVYDRAGSYEGGVVAGILIVVACVAVLLLLGPYRFPDSTTRVSGSNFDAA